MSPTFRSREFGTDPSDKGIDYFLPRKYHLSEFDHLSHIVIPLIARGPGTDMTPVDGILRGMKISNGAIGCLALSISFELSSYPMIVAY